MFNTALLKRAEEMEKYNIVGITFDNLILSNSLIEKLEELMEEDTLTIIGCFGEEPEIWKATRFIIYAGKEALATMKQLTDFFSSANISFSELPENVAKNLYEKSRTNKSSSTEKALSNNQLLISHNKTKQFTIENEDYPVTKEQIAFLHKFRSL